MTIAAAMLRQQRYQAERQSVARPMVPGRQLGTELEQTVVKLIAEGPTYAPDGSHVGLVGIYTLDELIDIAIQLEAKQHDR
jgi:hypothetical protein